MLPRVRIKEVPEDFVVEEIPAYEPTGAGGHLFLRFTKRGKTTDDAVRAIACELGVSPRDVGVAGLKDKVAVTTQTISLPLPAAEPAAAAFVERARSLVLDAITVLDARRHPHKLRTGHLAGNAFRIVLRGLANERVDEVVRSLERIAGKGLPNAFGAQRFGRDQDNAQRARAWIAGREAPPRDPRRRRLFWSALQAELFNELLAARVNAGTWATPLEGDLVKRRASGGLFSCTDPDTDGERAARGEVTPTGPIFGVKMRWPGGVPGELERQVLAENLGELFDFASVRTLGEGTRRALRLWVDDLRVERAANPSAAEQAESLRVYFVLPKGAYATTVLGEAVTWEAAAVDKESRDE